MGSAPPLLLPVRLRMTHGLSPETIRDLKHLRDGIQLALAHAQASKDKEKFVLPVKGVPARGGSGAYGGTA
jgi:hypothetical protein